MRILTVRFMTEMSDMILVTKAFYINWYLLHSTRGSPVSSSGHEQMALPSMLVQMASLPHGFGGPQGST